MTRQKTFALIYAAMLVSVAYDWAYIGAALFLCLMDFITAPSARSSAGLEQRTSNSQFAGSNPAERAKSAALPVMEIEGQ